MEIDKFINVYKCISWHFSFSILFTDTGEQNLNMNTTQKSAFLSYIWTWSIFLSLVLLQETSFSSSFFSSKTDVSIKGQLLTEITKQPNLPDKCNTLKIVCILQLIAICGSYSCNTLMKIALDVNNLQHLHLLTGLCSFLVELATWSVFCTAAACSLAFEKSLSISQKHII